MKFSNSSKLDCTRFGFGYFSFHLTMDTLTFSYMLPVIRAHWGLPPVRTWLCWAYHEKGHRKIRWPLVLDVFESELVSE